MADSEESAKCKLTPFAMPEVYHHHLRRRKSPSPSVITPVSCGHRILVDLPEQRGSSGVDLGIVLVPVHLRGGGTSDRAGQTGL